MHLVAYHLKNIKKRNFLEPSFYRTLVIGGIALCAKKHTLPSFSWKYKRILEICVKNVQSICLEENMISLVRKKNQAGFYN